MENFGAEAHPALESLGNYRQLVKRVDHLCARISEKFNDQIACRKGCCDCCSHISLFWVEAASLALALDSLPVGEAEKIRSSAQKTSSGGPCPLLRRDACLLYEDRPLICRTHGFPILVQDEDSARVDFCPKNFQSLSSLPSELVIDLEVLNATLIALNRQFVSEVFHSLSPEQDRLTIADALQLEL